MMILNKENSMKHVISKLVMSIFLICGANAYAETQKCELMQIGRTTKQAIEFIDGSVHLIHSAKKFPCEKVVVDFRTIETIEDKQVAVTHVCGHVSVLTEGWASQSDVFYAKLHGSYFKCGK
jgi:hypothetical protein